MCPIRQQLRSNEASIRVIDTHCHLDFDPLYQRLPEVLAAAGQANISDIVVPGVHPDAWERITGLTRLHEWVYPAYGVHPQHADLLDENVMERLIGLAASGVAIGEIGLDLSLPMPIDVQERAFRSQLRLAVALGLPVIVHSRRASQRTLQILKDEQIGRVGGVMHAFSGSLEMAREYIRLGLAISISGTVTWDNAVHPVRLSRELPLSCLVLESDAPYLAPQAFRGQPNQPSWIRETLLAVAKNRDMLVFDVANQLFNNSRSIFYKIP